MSNVIAQRGELPDDELRSALEESLRGHFRSKMCRIQSIRRAPLEYRSTFSIEDLEVTLSDGRALRVVFKNLGPGAVSAEVRPVKPAFLYNPRREIVVYRRLLGPAKLGTPPFYGFHVDEPANRFWLFLGKVQGAALNQEGRIEIWQAAARWLARMHAHFDGSADQCVDECLLIDHTPDFYRLWIERAHSFVGARLDALARGYDSVIAHLSALPRTLLHGEFFPSNILVEQNGRAPDALGAIRPVDWELAAAGPGLMDLAALTAGKWTDSQRELMVGAYAKEMAQCRGSSVDENAIRQSLDFARLHLAVQLLGWSEHWSPPPQHAHDWLGEALTLAAKLGL